MTCCNSNPSEKASANAGVKNSEMSILLIIIIHLHKFMYFQIFLPYANNLHPVMWFHLFLFNI